MTILDSPIASRLSSALAAIALAVDLALGAGALFGQGGLEGRRKWN